MSGGREEVLRYLQYQRRKLRLMELADVRHGHPTTLSQMRNGFEWRRRHILSIAGWRTSQGSFGRWSSRTAAMGTRRPFLCVSGWYRKRYRGNWGGRCKMCRGTMYATHLGSNDTRLKFAGFHLPVSLHYIFSQFVELIKV